MRLSCFLKLKSSDLKLTPTFLIPGIYQRYILCVYVLYVYMCVYISTHTYIDFFQLIKILKGSHFHTL